MGFRIEPELRTDHTNANVARSWVGCGAGRPISEDLEFVGVGVEWEGAVAKLKLDSLKIRA